MRPMLFVALLPLAGASQKIEAPSSGCYHSAFCPSGQSTFETNAGKAIAIEMNYYSWTSPDFPSGACQTIVNNGAVPHLTWEAWNPGSVNDDRFKLQRIIDGEHDAYIARWAQQIKTWGKRIFIRWGHEMNGNWYSWDGSHNGGATTNGYGDPSKADGPERYVAAYRRVHRIFADAGVTNVTWIWCPNNGSSPGESWNRPENYYPGSDVVDWLGIDGYNFGTSQSWSSWSSFESLYRSPYNTVCALGPGKPVMVGEFGCSEQGGDKAAWITAAYASMKSSFPQIKAVTWFDVNKETDWRINSTPAVLNAYKQAIGDAYFLSSVSTATGIKAIEPAHGGVRAGSTNLALCGTAQQARRSTYDLRGALCIPQVSGQAVRMVAIDR